MRSASRRRAKVDEPRPDGGSALTFQGIDRGITTGVVQCCPSRRAVSADAGHDNLGLRPAIRQQAKNIAREHIASRLLPDDPPTG